jgi:N-methylhydantoinase B
LNPADLQIFSSRLQGVAEQMSLALVRAARSANIKERRDCSTALFDPAGEMIAQYSQTPAHLGAMLDTVKVCIDKRPRPGDIFIANDPFAGGSHLPDVTLVSPVYDGPSLIGYAVSRAHYADIGGMVAGSMPAGARDIFQEGLRIPPIRLAVEGGVLPDVLDLILSNVRGSSERRGDLHAQLAANYVGGARLVELSDRYPDGGFLAATAELLAYAERRMAAGIRNIPNGRYVAEDVMEGDGISDHDIRICVTVTVDEESIHVDFSGTDRQTEGNINCPLPVTKSSCYFAMRAICAPDLPASGGAFRRVTVSAPPGTLVNALPPAAVAAGNVETGSRIADVILLAFAAELGFAQGQGTMNNVTFGGSTFAYYETIAGGQGAWSDADGESAIHVAMSNTLNTPVEAIETEYPLKVERYAVRWGSGGEGRHRGGDGVVRSIRVLESCTLSILSERRRHRPRGCQGGMAGEAGINELNGASLPAKCVIELNVGDLVTVQTPGGGGFGLPPTARSSR